MKKFFSALVALFAILTLVGCVKDDRLEITFWHAMGDTNQKIIAKMINSFEDQYPNVKVTQSPQGGYSDLLEKIRNNIKAGTGPTIAQTYPDHVITYLASKGAVVDMTEKSYDLEIGLEANGIDSSLYVESFWAESTNYDSKGSMYSLPFNKSTEVIYYNQTIFAKYNWFVDVLGYKAEDIYSNVANKTFKDDFVWNPTWQQLEKIGAEFVKTDEYKAIIAADKSAAAFGYDSQSNLFITLTQQLAALDETNKYGELGETAYTRFDENGNGEFTFLKDDNPYAKQAVEYYKEQYNKKYFATSGSLGADYCSDAFKEGRCIITVGSSAGATYNNPADKSFTVGVATYPQQEAADPSEYQVIQQGTNLTLFTQTDKEVEKYGWLFILWVINYENALRWCTETSYFPIRSDVYESEVYQNFVTGKKETDAGDVFYEPTLGSKAAKVGWSQQSWFYTNVAFSGTDIARTTIETLVEAVLLDEVKTVNEAFANAKEALKNYII